MKKSLLNKIEKLKPKAPKQLEVERKLLPRLKFMGYIMVCITLATFAFAVTLPSETAMITEIQEKDFSHPSQSGIGTLEEDGLDLSPRDVLNFYVVSFVFAVVAASCFLISWKKKKVLFHTEDK